MRILVTGAGGFVAGHLIRELIDHGHAVIGLDAQYPAPLRNVEQVYTGDLTDPDFVKATVKSVRPAACIHLGAISSVPAGVRDPNRMLSVNIFGTVNMLDALRCQAPECRTLVVSTAQIYAPSENGFSITEEGRLAPLSLYGISKVAADLTALAYATRYGMYVMTARPNNHTGPGQTASFVVPSFIRQLLALKQDKTENPVIRVGNLESERDFLDVRDVVQAYRLLLEKGRTAQAYNIASGRFHKISSILDMLCDYTGVHPDRIVDPEIFRPTDQSPCLDTGKITREIGWSPKFEISQTLQDTLEAERT